MPTGGEPACGVVGSVHSGILFVNHVRTHHTIHTSLIPFPPCVHPSSESETDGGRMNEWNGYD